MGNWNQKILAGRANREMTRKMQTLLSGLESPYRKIEWRCAGPLIQSQPLPKEIAEIVQSIFSSAGLTTSITASEKPDQTILAIDTSAKAIDPHEILAAHRKKVLAALEVPEDALVLRELVASINGAWNELSKPNQDVFNILRDAPPIVIAVAEKIDELLIGMKKSTVQKSTSEIAVLSYVYYSNLFLNLLSKSSPDFFRLVFKKTPLGPILIGAYQIASDAFYAKKALFNYRGSYWKMIWLVRGIDRALESIELTVKNKDNIGVEINPESLKSLLELYKKQLNKINAVSKTFTFSQSGQDIVKNRIQQAIKRTEALLERNRSLIQQQPRPQQPSQT